MQTDAHVVFSNENVNSYTSSFALVALMMTRYEPKHVGDVVI